MKPALNGVTFSLYKGELLGIAGLVGSGRTELARTIFGADPVDQGDIFVYGEKVCFASPREAVQKGMGFLTEDRKEMGLFLELNVRDNISVAALKKISRWGGVRRLFENQLVMDFVKQLRIMTPSLDQKVKFLSGGNQKKWLLPVG